MAIRLNEKLIKDRMDALVAAEDEEEAERKRRNQEEAFSNFIRGNVNLSLIDRLDMWIVKLLYMIGLVRSKEDIISRHKEKPHYYNILAYEVSQVMKDEDHSGVTILKKYIPWLKLYVRGVKDKDKIGEDPIVTLLDTVNAMCLTGIKSIGGRTLKRSMGRQGVRDSSAEVIALALATTVDKLGPQEGEIYPPYSVSTASVKSDTAADPLTVVVPQSPQEIALYWLWDGSSLTKGGSPRHLELFARLAEPEFQTRRLVGHFIHAGSVRRQRRALYDDAWHLFRQYALNIVNVLARAREEGDSEGGSGANILENATGEGRYDDDEQVTQLLCEWLEEGHRDRYWPEFTAVSACHPELLARWGSTWEGWPGLADVEEDLAIENKMWEELERRAFVRYARAARVVLEMVAFTEAHFQWDWQTFVERLEDGDLQRETFELGRPMGYE